MLDTLEPRALMAADMLGVFAVQQGTLAAPNQSVSEKILIQKDSFHSSSHGPVMLRIETVAGGGQTSLGPLNLNATQNPVGRRALPSTWQTKSGDSGLLARVRNGSYVVSAGYGLSNFNGDYEFQYRLAGDVDGSYQVTNQDLALIRTGIKNPSSLTPGQFANADVDGNGVINCRDMQLASSNLGASTSIRPLSLDAGIGSATPHKNMIVRLATGQIVASTDANAKVVFTNNTNGEELQATADASGQAHESLSLAASMINEIDVSASDAFGQSLNKQVFVDQRPVPVVIVPGYTTSLPTDENDMLAFAMQIGFPADKLSVIPPWTKNLGENDVYENIQVMLGNAGYARNLDQFIVPYDWRLPIAPYDGVQDGVLSAVTAASITQTQPQFSLGYLGNFLKQMVENDPSIVQVDMMGHSNGGLMTRSYIQSLAYGASFTDKGQTYELPTVGKAFLLAAPSEGAAMAWPVWNNDVSSFTLTSSETIRALLEFPYDAVTAGGVVTSPLGNIDLAAITDPSTGQPNPLTFLRLYGASLRDLLPTYDFLYAPNGTQLTNINSDPASANYTVLDINATSHQGSNPWTSKVSQVTATYGVYPDLNANLMTTQTNDQTVIADGTSGSIWPFQEDTPITPAAGTIYYTPISFAKGDSVVPFISQVATYDGDPTILIVQWGNGLSQPGLTWTNTAGVVVHGTYVTNSDVLELLRQRLSAW